jgi:hypothetical protein
MVAEVRQAPPDARARFGWLRKSVLPALVLVVMTLAAYAPVTNSGFVWDDDLYVTGNAHLKNAAGLFDMWFRLGSTTMYVPALSTSPASSSCGTSCDGSRSAAPGSRRRCSACTP